MAEKRNAYEILGLKEGAGKDEILKRYNILYKKYLSEKSSGSTESDINFDEINSAYNELMGLSTEGENLPGRPENKLVNFFYYHKYHIIIGVVVLIFVVYFLKTLIGYVEPDLKIALVGNFSFKGIDSLETQIYSDIKEVKKAEIDSLIGWDEGNANIQSAMETKLATLSVKGNIDLYLLDEKQFDNLADKGVLENLDGFFKDTGDDSLKGREYKVKSKKDQEEHIYGFDVSDSSIIKDLLVQNGKMIFALGHRGKNTENTLELIHLLLNIP